MRTDTGIQAYPLDDGLRIQSLHLSVGVQLIEIADTQSQIGIGEQLHRLRLFHAHEQGGDVLLDGPLPQQGGKGMRSLF